MVAGHKGVHGVSIGIWKRVECASSLNSVGLYGVFIGGGKRARSLNFAGRYDHTQRFGHLQELA